MRLLQTDLLGSQLPILKEDGTLTLETAQALPKIFYHGLDQVAGLLYHGVQALVRCAGFLHAGCAVAVSAYGVNHTHLWKSYTDLLCMHPDLTDHLQADCCQDLLGLSTRSCPLRVFSLYELYFLRAF